MKLFISYARVDTPLCKQIVEKLSDVHEVWYDKRLFSGMDWWAEIQRRIHWADGFVYLLSPESVKSEYCNKEYNIARAAQKRIFPVLIQARTEIPDHLGVIQFADLSMGMENFHTLLNALLIAERDMPSQVEPLPAAQAEQIDASVAPKADQDPMELLGEAGTEMDEKDFDRALFLLKQLQDRQDLPRSMQRMVESMVKQAEAGLERQAYLQKAEYEYKPIVEMMKRGMRDVGCNAYELFRADYPDYDPENIAKLCGGSSKVTQEMLARIDITAILPEPFEWVEIPDGKVEIVDASDQGGSRGGAFKVGAFLIGRYPISNAQFQTFIDDANGYGAPQWWEFSPEAQRFHESNPIPKAPVYADDDLMPRTDVNWYEAMAFCAWLSDNIGQTVTLPTEEQWQRAAQGDDGRQFPWGNSFDDKKCNTNVSGIKQPTAINQYPNGASPFGVLDMAGNVFEWCLTEWESGTTSLQGNAKRVLRGGSWFNDPAETRVAARNWLNPDLRSSDRGFRIVVG